MSGSFTVTMSSLSGLNIGPSRRSEALEIQEIVQRYLQVVSSSHTTATVQMKDRFGNAAGTMTWVPVNSA